MFGSWFDTLNKENAALRSQLACQRAENEQLRAYIGHLHKQKDGYPLAPDEVEHLQWIYSRLVAVHGERPCYDYMVKLDKIIQKTIGTEQKEWPYATQD